jgi:hypothetical protein
VPGPAASPPSGPRLSGPAVVALLAAASALLLAAAPGVAAAAPTSATGAFASPVPATPPASTHALCRVTDPRLPELSGLVATGDELLAMNDGGDRLTVYVLDTACRVVDIRSAPVDPYDPEDLALGADGTVWLSDTGDNLAQRPTVALLGLHPDGTTTIYRMTYPDGPHDAEALLLAPDGTPYVVTKEVLGNSGVYRPAAALVDGGTVPMVKVAALAFALTGTQGGPVGRAGELMVTGGAVSPDGRFLALRTYTDAYLWPLTSSDVPAALKEKPVRIPLPPAPQGEAISFAADSRQLVVAGEGVPGDVTVVTPPADLLPAAATAATTATATASARGHAGVPTLTAAVIAAVTATLVVWLVGVFRRRRV